MNKTHQAISGMIECVVLISIAVIGGGMLYVGLNDFSLEQIECEIQELQVYEISNNNYWGTLKVLNSGDFVIDNYDLIMYNDGTITTDHTKTTINPDQTIDIEFKINGNLIDNVIMGLDISNQEQSSICKKRIEI